jgi:hypothetical protein
MFCRRTNVFGFSLGLLMSAFFLPGCAKRNEPAKSVEPAPRVASTIEPAARVLSMASPTPTPTLPSKPSAPPNPTEIRDTVVRVFEKAATPDASREPNFVVGDFNGDGSEDLAVAVKATEGSLDTINSELANWILEDPKNIFVQRTGAAQMPSHKPVRVAKGDLLLAIIHGFGPQGWRSPEARQTFLLKNATGSNLVVQSVKDLRDKKEMQKLPALRGDAISETVGGKTGLLFWTGAKYGWYSSTPE